MALDFWNLSLPFVMGSLESEDIETSGPVLDLLNCQEPLCFGQAHWKPLELSCV